MVLSRMILKWLVKDGLPFLTVEKSGFQELLLKMGVVDDVKKIPTESYLRKFVLQDVYTYVKTKIIDITKNIKFVNLQVDMWTDNHAGNAYIGIVINYIDSDWKRQNLVLETKGFGHPHTALRIKHEILECLQEYKISQKICHAVTDNGSNIKAVFKLRDIHISHSSCLAHNINLLLRPDGCDKVPEVRDTLKNLSTLHTAIVYRKADLLKASREKKQLEVIKQIISLGNSSLSILRIEINIIIFFLIFQKMKIIQNHVLFQMKVKRDIRNCILVHLQDGFAFSNFVIVFWSCMVI